MCASVPFVLFYQALPLENFRGGCTPLPIFWEGYSPPPPALHFLCLCPILCVCTYSYELLKAFTINLTTYLKGFKLLQNILISCEELLEVPSHICSHRLQRRRPHPQWHYTHNIRITSCYPHAYVFRPLDNHTPTCTCTCACALYILYQYIGY